MKRIKTAELMRLQDIRAEQRRLENINQTLTSLVASAARAAKIALWKAQSLEEQNKIALLTEALRLLDAAQGKTTPTRKKA